MFVFSRHRPVDEKLPPAIDWDDPLNAVCSLQGDSLLFEFNPGVLQVEVKLAGGEGDSQVPHPRVFECFLQADNSTRRLRFSQFAGIEVTIRIEIQDSAASN